MPFQTKSLAVRYRMLCTVIITKPYNNDDQVHVGIHAYYTLVIVIVTHR